MFLPSSMPCPADQRGDPFLSPLLDDLDSFDAVLNNLVDRTALTRYMVWDVKVDGDDKVIEKYISDEGGGMCRARVGWRSTTRVWSRTEWQVGAGGHGVTTGC